MVTTSLFCAYFTEQYRKSMLIIGTLFVKIYDDFHESFLKNNCLGT